MTPVEIGEKVLRGIQRKDFYIFPHPEHRDELRAIFDEVIAAFPDEEAPPDRLAFEEAGAQRRHRLARAGRRSDDGAGRGEGRLHHGRRPAASASASPRPSCAGMRVVLADMRRGPPRRGARLVRRAGAEGAVKCWSSTSPTARGSSPRGRRGREAPSATCTCSSTTPASASSGRSTSAATTTGTSGLGVLLGGVVNGIQTFLPRIRAHGEGGHIVNTVVDGRSRPDSRRFDLRHREVRDPGPVRVAARRARGGRDRRLRVLPGPAPNNIRELGKVRPERYKQDSGYAEFEQHPRRVQSRLVAGPGRGGGARGARHPAQ